MQPNDNLQNTRTRLVKLLEGSAFSVNEPVV